MVRIPQPLQISLRTIFELIFVVAVVLAFLYWRTIPHGQAGRYQVIHLGGIDLLFIDTQTGKAWRGMPGGHWVPAGMPLDEANKTGP